MNIKLIVAVCTLVCIAAQASAGKPDTRARSLVRESESGAESDLYWYFYQREIAGSTIVNTNSVTLSASNTPDDFNHPGPNYNVINPGQADDYAAYSSPGDWLRDPDIGFFLDGVVDDVGSFGMVVGADIGVYPEGYDRQVKNVQEYDLGHAYAAGITGETLGSARIIITVDRVADMLLEGCTDCYGSEWLYVHVFAGDGELVSPSGLQADFDRCDRSRPETWDAVVHLVSERGERLSDDEIDFYGGRIEIEIDVTSRVRELLAENASFAGFTLASSNDGEFTLISIDGGSYPTTVLPELALVSRRVFQKTRDAEGVSAGQGDPEMLAGTRPGRAGAGQRGTSAPLDEHGAELDDPALVEQMDGMLRRRLFER